MTQTPRHPTTSDSARMLAPNFVASRVDGGRIGENIVQFVRLLRAAGLPVGPEKTVRATEAVLAAGLDNPKTLYWALHAVLVNKRSEREIFNQAFVMFWRDPGYLEQMLSLMLPQMRPDQPQEQTDSALSRRMSESLFKNRRDKAPNEPDKLELEAHETWSSSEILRSKDFEQMGADELKAARRTMEKLRLPLDEIRTRRFEPSAHGRRLDLRRILRETGSKGSDHILPHYKRPRWRRPPVVVLCDISGSMDAYARILLHFLYALTNDRDRVHTFLFGTRLSNITRALKSKDPDVAISQSRQRRRRLVRRHAHRRLPRRVQPALGAPRPRPERAGPAVHRWPRPGRRARPGDRRAPAVGQLPPPRLAQSVDALRRLRAFGGWRQGPIGARRTRCVAATICKRWKIWRKALAHTIGAAERTLANLGLACGLPSKKAERSQN